MSTALETKTETVRFIARCPDQVLTRRPEQKVPNGFGGSYIETRATYLRDMEAKNQEREANKIKPLPIDDSPWKVEFANHVFETDDPRLIEWMRSLPTFRSNGPSGFYEEPPILDPVKEMAEPMKRIAVAGAAADVDTLVEIRDAHKENRPEIAEAAEAAIREIAEGPSESEADAGSTGDGHGPHEPHGTT